MLEKVIVHQQYAGYGDWIYGAQDERPDLTDDEAIDPVAKIWQAAPVNAALGKSSGASVVLDLSVPEGDVDSDDAPLYKAPRIVLGVSNALLRTGDEKFVKVIATIRRVFAGHEEEMAEALEIVTRIRSDARNEAIAQI
jgi:hypothetical protein